MPSTARRSRRPNESSTQSPRGALRAVRAGARQIQGTLNGLGERCGNANLTSIIPTLVLKPEYAERFETGVTPEKLRTLTHASRVLDEVLNRAPNRHAPYVGEAAFAHKGGIHVSAVQKDPRTYEHIAPDTVGNRRKMLRRSLDGRVDEEQFAAAGIDPTERPESLDITAWGRLTAAVGGGPA